MSAQEREPTDEIQQLESEVQLMMEESQASMVHDMREMVAECMRNYGTSEFSSAEGSAAVRGSPRAAESTAIRGNSAEDSPAVKGSPRGTEPTAARQISAAAADGGGAREDTTAARDTTFREYASRNVGVTGRRGAAVSVKVGPARGQPDPPRGAGQYEPYPGGELGVGYHMPLPRLAPKHAAVPSFSGEKPEFTAWAKDARY